MQHQTSLRLSHVSGWQASAALIGTPAANELHVYLLCCWGPAVLMLRLARRPAGHLSWHMHDGTQPLLAAEALSVGVAAVASTARDIRWRRSLLSAEPARAARRQNGAGTSAAMGLQGRTLAQSSGLPAAVEAPRAEPTPSPTPSPFQQSQGNFGFSINNNVAFVGGEGRCVCCRPAAMLRPLSCQL